MFSIYYCIHDDHDLRLVLLAGLICIAAALGVVTLIRQARDARIADRARWLVASGMAGGFGIWATHFIAMMGYDPGVIMGYAVVPTILSLMVAIAAVGTGLWLALRSSGWLQRLLAGAIIGLGIAAMHYLGMQAVEMAADFRWSPTFVIASMLFAIAPLPAALALAIDRRRKGSALGAAGLISIAILALHFTGMAGIRIIPNNSLAPTDLLLSPLGMGIAIAVAALVILSMSSFCAIISGRARAAIDASEREFKVLVQGISDCAIYMLSPDGTVTTWNAGAQRLKGYTSDEAIGLDISAFCSPADRAAGLPARSIEIARQTGKYTAEGWRYRKDGSRFWAQVTIEAVHDEHGALHGFAKITRDITRMKEDQESLERVTANLDAALANMHQGLWLFGPDERLVLTNDRAKEMLGIPREDGLAGTSFEDMVGIGTVRRFGKLMSRDILDEALERHRKCIASPGGGVLVVPFVDGRTLSVAHRPMTNGGWVTTLDDITDRRLAEERIEHMALHDSLTGLPNRVHYTERLDAELMRAARANGRVTVIGIDLDRFKEINDLHGHATGDKVLKVLSERMSDVLQPGEVVARFGGDEFMAFKAFEEHAELTDFVGRLETCLTALIEVDGGSIYPGASLGVAIFPTDGVTREQVVNNADLAMYRAKDTIGRQVCYYEHGMDEVARTRRMRANDLREAIARNELTLAYQVQKAVTTEQVIGYEALLRWNHPRDGWIPPAEFIPIAEECGEIIRIGEWVLRAACADAATWAEPWKLAVNLSPIQLMHTDLVNTIIRALFESGLPANRLELEITETAFIADKVRALHVLRQIKALGVSIAIDDFGTGYSSLDTLNSFPFDKIKIDKSFLLESDKSHQARAIIRAVLALGRSLEVPVLAEGLESEDQLRLLRAEGCDEAQGFLWGRPASLPDDARKSGDPLVNAA
jgi:diguanylate cyclase (GGDEF)-like protein/PAS domain S-box-containing protein